MHARAQAVGVATLHAIRERSNGTEIDCTCIGLPRMPLRNTQYSNGTEIHCIALASLGNNAITVPATPTITGKHGGP